MVERILADASRHFHPRIHPSVDAAPPLGGVLRRSKSTRAGVPARTTMAFAPDARLRGRSPRIMEFGGPVCATHVCVRPVLPFHFLL